MEVRKAVILAAGRGTRLGSITTEIPKPLLHIGDRAIIARILEGLRSAGVSEALLVVGYLGEQIEGALGDGGSVGVSLTYARQAAPEGTGRAVALAREFVGGDRFFVGWGDILVGPDNYARLLLESQQASGALAVNEVSDPTAGAAVYVDAAMRVTGIVEKPAPGTAATRWNNAGLMVLPPEIWPFIDALEPSARGEYELPQAVAAFIVGGGDIRAVPIQGPWFDIGTPADLEAARAAFSRRSAL